MSMIVQNACDLLKRGEAFILATIISHSGSTPRTAGSRMIVTADGRGIGTIGGGLLEAEAMSRALQLMQSGQSAILPVDLNHDTIDAMNMICGGVVEVLLDYVAPTPTNRSHFERWRRMLEDREKGCLLTFVSGSGDPVETIAHGLVTDAGEIGGELPLTDTQRATILAAAVESSAVQVLPLDGGLVVLEPTQWVCSAYLFGAGHVAQATATVAAMVGFRVSVSDDREAYANRERFPDSHEVRVIATFAHAFRHDRQPQKEKHDLRGLAKGRLFPGRYRPGAFSHRLVHRRRNPGRDRREYCGGDDPTSGNYLKSHGRRCASSRIGPAVHHSIRIDHDALNGSHGTFFGDRVPHAL